MAILKSIYIFFVAGLAVGLLAGYFYGQSVGSVGGIERGRADLLAEQQKAQEEETAKLQEELQAAANPFTADKSAANPFKEGEGYANPFKGATVNPFAQ